MASIRKALNLRNIGRTILKGFEVPKPKPIFNKNMFRSLGGVFKSDFPNAALGIEPKKKTKEIIIEIEIENE